MNASAACNCGEYHDTKCPVAKELRNSWCTPQWLADLIGYVDVDPCSNDRSHVKARTTCILERGDNGLHGEMRGVLTLAEGIGFMVPNDWSVFINPPYAGGQVIKWVRHYRHTKFIYLLRWDPSTEWFAELIEHCTHVWFPPSRIDFEPPPRIHESSNPYPHALYLRDPLEDLLDRLRGAGFLFTVDEVFPCLHSAGNGRLTTSDKPSGERRGGSSGECDAGRGTARAGGTRIRDGRGTQPTAEDETRGPIHDPPA